MKKNSLKQRLHESLLNEEFVNKGDVNKIVSEKVKKEVEKLLNSTQYKKQIREISAQVVEKFIDTLFIRKQFFKTQLRR
ncbi:hypothetical protein COB55_03840 [Candidatus Wolfebacteria bacterium]|nr:MAG: hypothetical protein COB55_03840 [Candidatus Wolfebacteria bacterium]